MEATEGLLEKIKPPRLEDAGLEDCALPPESIKEAFLKAASAVRSHAASILSPSDDDEAEDCLEDPWPTVAESSDTLVGIKPDTEPPGSCASEKGGRVPEVLGDDVKVGLSDGENVAADKLLGPDDDVREEGESCVNELQGLKIKKSKENEDERESQRPTLTQGYV